MDSPPLFRFVSDPADGSGTRIFNNLRIPNQLNGGDGSNEQQLPVPSRGGDYRSVVSNSHPPVEIGPHRDLPARVPSQERSTPLIYTPMSDTESGRSTIEQSANSSRQPRKIPSRREPSSAYQGSIYVPTTHNRKKSTYSIYTDSESGNDDYTASEIQRLEGQIQDLEAKLRQKNSSARQPPQSEPSRYQTLYRVGYEVRPNVHGTSSDEYSSPSDSDEPYRRGNNWYMYPEAPRRDRRNLKIFTDPPVLTHDRWGKASLRSSRRVDSLKSFLKSNPDISFVVFHDYNIVPEPGLDLPESSPGEVMGDRESNQPTPRARSIYPVSKELKKALELILENRQEYSSMFSQYWNTNELSAPYLFIYHSRQEIPKIKEELSKPAQDQLDNFLEYVMKEFGEEYDTVDSLLKRNEILPQYFHYLVKRGDILVENRNGEYTGYKAESWPTESIRRTPNSSILIKYGMPGNEYESPNESGVTHQWTLTGFTWGFDGSFFGRWKQLKIEMGQDESSLSNESGVVRNETNTAQLKGQPIANLAVFPLRYAPDHIQKILHHRGDVLWKCRVRQLVSYKVNEQDSIGNGMEGHYMIDMKTYQSLHRKDKTPDNTLPVFPRYPSPPKKLLSKAKMARIDPPGDDFKVLMPPKIKGYNFCRKQWHDLKVDQISDVVWQGDVFRTLEIDYEAKDLLQALVMTHVEMENSADCTAGKGSGLTILLHGGPGTGKTHTAESVAEIAKKPLYRVACGDLGTREDVVEQYLESALHLARLWGCVVLLDEADVFLEQLSLGDRERNELAAVFLRMLKAYDGIVILTTTRASKFNEAFRSEIQLALHFPALNAYQRSMIWRNLIKQLESQRIDASELWDHAEILGKENLNGRQIKQILTNACLYARWKKMPLTFYRIKDVIEVSGRLDSFLENGDGGELQDELASGEWIF
ncbi:hypothetical protein TMatcc_005822 [Talaromyces marneffei ATCC 18224]|nr:uncharacterized protein EYB26_005668 [Talaromyces marneffei]QGA17990.1 hypothetical protein EYB26_005668 [Talaromyces marneffei]